MFDSFSRSPDATSPWLAGSEDVASTGSSPDPSFGAIASYQTCGCCGRFHGPTDGSKGEGQGIILNADDRGVSGPNGKPSLDTTDAGAQISRMNMSWASGFGQAAVVTFAFRLSASTMPTDTTGFSQFSGAQIDATLLALSAWSDVSNITFNRVTNAGSQYSNNATILFANYADGQEGAAAFAYLPQDMPGLTASDEVAGDIWVSSSETYNVNPAMQGYGHQVLLHEIGHAIGLSHPAAYNASAGNDITYGASATYFEDSRQYTVMSYFSERETGADFRINGTGVTRYSAVPLLDDIAAVQRLYGANMSTRTGNTTYGFNSNAGQPWFNAGLGALIFAVWDAGGADTFDFSGYSMAQTIDLRQGAFSSVGSLVGNVAIAVGAVIENVVGGTGIDTIRGNSAANMITGNGGGDVIDGGLGSDTAVFSGTRASYTVTWDGRVGTVSGPGGTVTLTNVEFLQFSDQTLAAAPTGGLLVGGDITDETINGTTFADTIGGLGGADTVNGLAGADTLNGGSGDDVLNGAEADDSLIGGLGDDALNGGTGYDIADYSAAGDGVIVDLSAGTASGGAGSDTLSGIEEVRGTADADTLTGDAGANVLRGGGGVDSLNGGGGADQLFSGVPGEGGGEPDIVKPQGTANGSIGAAVSLAGAFDLGTRSDVANANTIPHATVVATTHGGMEYYAVTVGAGDTVVFDIDNASFDSVLRIYNAGGTQLAQNDDSASDGGSGTDSNVSFTFPSAGTYYVEVSRWLSGLEAEGTLATAAPNAGGTYTLHVSVPSAPVTPVEFLGSTMNGDAGADALNGDVGRDTLNGGADDDLLTGGGGNDVMDGGAGTDTAIFSGDRGAYTVSVSSGVTTVTGADGTDTIRNVERLQFDDGLFNASGAPLSGSIDGTAGADSLNGTPEADAINGLDGDDVLNGLAGDDLIHGGAGNDLIDSGPGVDEAYGDAGDDTLVLTAIAAGPPYSTFDGGSGFDTFDASAISVGMAFNGSTVDGQFTVGDNSVLGTEAVIAGSAGDQLDFRAFTTALDLSSGGGADVMQGGTAGDRLYGGEGADQLTGLSGDQLFGENGDDLLIVQGGGAATGVLAAGGGGLDTVVLRGASASLDLASGSGVVGSTALSAYTIENVTVEGSGASVRTVMGAGSANRLSAASGSAFGVIFDGRGGDDILTGALGADVLRGGAGADVLIGGGGIDTADYSGAGGGVTASLTTGAASNDGDGGSDGFSEIENLTGSAFADRLTGSGADNVLTGGAGADRLEGLGGADVLRGGAGADVLIGGAGIDTADYGGAAGGVTASLTTGTASNDGDGGSDSFSEIENLTGSAFGDGLTGSGAANVLSGGAGADTLAGLGGDDVLRGGAGADVLDGGAGIDTADYSQAAAGVRAQLNTGAASNDGDGGTDGFSGIENLTGSAFNDLLVGHGGVNVLRGGSGTDTLLGQAGDDVLWGGAGAANSLYGGLGDDWFVLEANDTVVEFAGEGIDTVEARIAVYNLGGHIERLVFTGTGGFTGTGNGLDNTITGGAGDDVLRGRGGDDLLNGGAGTDTADYSQATAGVLARLDLSRALNDGEGGADSLVSIENLGGSQHNDVLVGNGAANVLRGGLGQDVLLGQAGNDVLMGGQGAPNQVQGGLGDDWFVLDAADSVIEHAGEGIDTVEARISTYTLAAHVENLVYTGTASFSGWGNGLANHITGGSANDYLRGMGGNDVVDGGAGTDTLYLRGAAADYTVTAESGGWRIVDAVAGRDGSTYVESVEVLRFLTGNTASVLTYPAASATAAGAKASPLTDDADAFIPIASPAGVDDDFLPPAPPALPMIGAAQTLVFDPMHGLGDLHPHIDPWG